MTSAAPAILVVDDVPQNLLAMRALLADEGVEVLTAGSGTEALEWLLKREVALALLDVQMAGMDGYELAELMRGTERTRHVPIVFLTAGSRDEQRSFRGYEAGAVDFLYKPVDPRVLRAKVQVFVDLERQRRELSGRMAELERLSRVNALMLAALSHDIRTPLAALALNAELVIRRAELPGLRQAGERIKATTSMIGRQVDHLLSLASLPCTELRPTLAPGDLAALVRERLEASAELRPQSEPAELAVDGDTRAEFDAALLSEALDQLLLAAAVHGEGAAVRLAIDGSSLRALVLRLGVDTVLPGPARLHLLGDGESAPGVRAPPVGPGLDAAERIARAHGGSLVGRSREREGTSFELILPRSDRVG
ncbi:ATP-binding response regulator [Piscinibacter sakaiensis]|uniref:histidine kinase n=1 Tax=Piscinibacter sakaiensis TaxID=1547922 RepID=A0A0K8P1V9_PISS1|nr:response regulator [Piscinibacter sakaiensis]GAP36621.1 two-component hybrid sensor and regulator [Piscinibacter sakaiensis]